MSTTRIYTFSERVGMIFTVESAILSLAAVTFILLFAFVRWLKKLRDPRASQFEATDSSLFLNLMVADLLHALGTVLNVRWLADAHISDGPLCKFQAGTKHFGMTAVGISSLSIAVYTFMVLVMRHIPSKNGSMYGVIGVWVAVFLICGTPNLIHVAKGEQMYGPTGYWCWIKYDFRAEQLATMYLWLWVAAFCMIVLYGLIFCAIQGWIKTPRSGFMTRSRETNTFSSEHSAQEEEPEYKKTKAVARLMLYFPLTFIITVLPNSVSRWSEFTGRKPPPPVTLFANTVFAFSGMANFILFFATRPRMVIGEKVIIRETVRPARPQSHPLHWIKDPYAPGEYGSGKVDVELAPINESV